MEDLDGLIDEASRVGKIISGALAGHEYVFCLGILMSATAILIRDESERSVDRGDYAEHLLKMYPTFLRKYFDETTQWKTKDAAH